MAAASSHERAMKIESAIRREYFTSGRVRYWPSAFAEQGFGTPDEVTDALAELAVTDRLTTRITVRCPNDHDVYVGSRLPEYFPRCRECGEPSSEDEGGCLYIEFRLSQDWRDVLDAEKKTPLHH